ncbi:hypothetical protein A2U01_0001152 [Trifolium medium]|uniref:Uncharacterized protein n=1 Tax=Trifolium medium TaxID=97028 RepID=A0A392LZI1_9FABA|nr:hypothetical protein [Trifolium medium]
MDDKTSFARPREGERVRAVVRRIGRSRLSGDGRGGKKENLDGISHCLFVAVTSNSACVFRRS